MAPLTPLLRPDRYFEKRESSAWRVTVVVAVVTLASVVAVYAIGSILEGRINGTVMVDNPTYPGERVCGDDFFDQTGCDQPREVERNIDSFLGPAVDSIATQMLWAMPFGWLVVAAFLHVGSWLAGGDGGFGRSLAVAGWGMTTTLASLFGAVLALYLTFDPITITASSSPETFASVFFDHLETAGLIAGIFGFVAALWSAVIWRYGLEHERSLSAEGAWIVAVVVAVVLGIVAMA